MLARCAFPGSAGSGGSGAGARGPTLHGYPEPHVFQRNPLNIGPLPRLVTVDVDTPGGGRILCWRLFFCERNRSDRDLQAEDWYVEVNHMQQSGHGSPPTAVL